MGHSVIFVGLDVHAAQVHAARLEAASGELSTTRVGGGSGPTLAWLRCQGPGVVAVYEAGPTGFGLARAARAEGIDLRVVTPGLIPKRPTDRVKTDRRDAVRLARLLAAGALSFARVPTLEEEQFRDLVRAREDVRGDLMRARHRLSKFLLRRELVFPGPGKAWTQAHLVWLSGLIFDDAASQATLADYLAGVQTLLQRRSTLEVTLERLVPASPHAATVAGLRCFRGVDTLTAAGLCAEVGDFARFEHPRQLAGYLGIVPSEHTSDAKRRQGAITKAGPAHARRLLIEASHHYRRPPRLGTALARRQEGQDPRVCQVAWRAQQRLHRQWQRLRTERGNPPGSWRSPAPASCPHSCGRPPPSPDPSRSALPGRARAPAGPDRRIQGSAS